MMICFFFSLNLFLNTFYYYFLKHVTNTITGKIMFAANVFQLLHKDNGCLVPF